MLRIFGDSAEFEINRTSVWCAYQRGDPALIDCNISILAQVICLVKRLTIYLITRRLYKIFMKTPVIIAAYNEAAHKERAAPGRTPYARYRALQIRKSKNDTRSPVYN